MNRLKKIPFFIFLLPVFFCLHGLLENFEVLSLPEVLLTGFYICLALALLFLVLWLITKNKQHAALGSFYAGVCYLFFGAIQDWLQNIAWLSFLNRYLVLLPFLFISLAALLYFLKRKPALYRKLFLYLNMLLIIYCLVDTALLLNRSFSSQKNSISSVSFDQEKVVSKPDVYYLLFDEYPGYKSLQSATGFKNDSLYSFLQHKGFTILPTFSNYNFTMFSMSSIFNMQYVEGNYNHDHDSATQQDFRNRFREIKNASVFSIYRSMGYRFENYSIFDIGDQTCIDPQRSFLPVHSRVLTTKMLHYRLRKHIGWWFRGTMLQDIFVNKEPIYYTDQINNDIINALNKSLLKKNGQPTFCYAHFMMPHAPYFRDSSGALISKNQRINLMDDQYFLPYLKYTNTVISSLVNKIVQHNPSAIVIVMSDHGFRDYKDHQRVNSPAFDNICALRLPGNDPLPGTTIRSTVNFFRYLFNKGYNQQIPYLKDSTTWIKY